MPEIQFSTARTTAADPTVAAWAEQHHHLYIVEDLAFDWHSATLLWELDSD